MKPAFQSHQIKQIDQLTARYLQINSYQLMQVAGKAVFEYVKNHKTICVVAGIGNNAGDGFVIAKLAKEAGIETYVWCLADSDSFNGDALLALQDFLDGGGKVFNSPPDIQYDCIVDALFGTGLSRDLQGIYADAVNWINSQNSKTLSVDIPSGLHADTGCIRGVAVMADVTVTVISYKPGLLTNDGKDCCGQLFLENLDVSQEIFNMQEPVIGILDSSLFDHPLFSRLHNSHKGSFGRAVIVGGNDGMLGAAILAGRSALRSGCGLVETVSNCEHPEWISLQCPELLTASGVDSSRLLKHTDVIAIGPGLGLNTESRDILNHCMALGKPLVVDADAITLAARERYVFNTPAVLTPHPKEAAVLLNTTTAKIQSDRISSAKKISETYHCTTVLKGSGTVICDTSGNTYICPYGYPGMATAGMGDVLTGLIAGLMAQGFSDIQAANTAVIWHALTAEDSRKGNCLLASDVIENLYRKIL